MSITIEDKWMEQAIIATQQLVDYSKECSDRYYKKEKEKKAMLENINEMKKQQEIIQKEISELSVQIKLKQDFFVQSKPITKELEEQNNEISNKLSQIRENSLNHKNNMLEIYMGINPSIKTLNRLASVLNTLTKSVHNISSLNSYDNKGLFNRLSKLQVKHDKIKAKAADQALLISTLQDLQEAMNEHKKQSLHHSNISNVKNQTKQEEDQLKQKLLQIQEENKIFNQKMQNIQALIDKKKEIELQIKSFSIEIEEQKQLQIEQLRQQISNQDQEISFLQQEIQELKAKELVYHEVNTDTYSVPKINSQLPQIPIIQKPPPQSTPLNSSVIHQLLQRAQEIGGS